MVFITLLHTIQKNSFHYTANVNTAARTTANKEFGEPHVNNFAYLQHFRKLMLFQFLKIALSENTSSLSVFPRSYHINRVCINPLSEGPKTWSHLLATIRPFSFTHKYTRTVCIRQRVCLYRAFCVTGRGLQSDWLASWGLTHRVYVRRCSELWRPCLHPGTVEGHSVILVHQGLMLI